MPASDTKFVIRDQEARERLRAGLAAGLIPPLSAVFQDGVVRRLEDDQKGGETIVQMSFLITNPAHDVMPVLRSAFDQKLASSGHSLLEGASLLVSWSPIQNREGVRHPQWLKDIEFFYEQELQDAAAGVGRSLSFLGLIENHVPKSGATYLFYVWEVVHCVSAGECPVAAAFRKDRFDSPGVLQPVSRDLIESLKGRRADLQALRALERKHDLKFDWPDDLDLNGSALWTPAVTDAGRMADVIEEPLPHVFVSKTSRDDPVVRVLVSAMRAKGIRIWVDNDDLQSGTHWYAQAEVAIHYAPVFLVVLSSPGASGGMLAEIQQAVRLHEARRKMDWAMPKIETVALANRDEPKHKLLPEELVGYPVTAIASTADGMTADEIAAVVGNVERHLLRLGHF